MSYIPTNLFQTGSQLPGGINEWHYFTTDSLSSVNAANYFVDGALQGMKIGDEIIVFIYTSYNRDSGNFTGFLSRNQEIVSATNGFSATIAATTPSGIVPISNGGTGQTTASAAFNALSPMTTVGDLIYGGTSGAGTRLGVGSAGQVLIGGSTPSWGAVNLGSMVTGTLPVANGGTGQASASAAFNALSPMTASGDLIYGGVSGAGTRLGIGTAGQVLGVNNSGAPAWLAGPVFIESSVTYTVNPGSPNNATAAGGNFQNLTQAIAFLASAIISTSPTVSVVLQLPDGTVNYTSTLEAQNDFTKQVFITGTNTYTKSLTSVQSSSGSAGAWSYALNVSDVNNVAAGDYVTIGGTAAGTNPTYLEGCWPVTAVDTVNKRITITNTGYGATAASGSVTGTVTVLKTVLTFTGCNGFNVWTQCGLNLANLAIVGDGTTAADGLSVQDGSRLSLGNTLGNGIVGVYNFGRCGAYINYASHVTNGSVFIGGCVSDGLNMEENASVNLAYLASGGNGGNGISIFGGSVVKAGGTYGTPCGSASGNAGIGIKAYYAGFVTIFGGFDASGNVGAAYYEGLAGRIAVPYLTGSNNSSCNFTTNVAPRANLVIFDAGSGVGMGGLQAQYSTGSSFGSAKLILNSGGGNIILGPNNGISTDQVNIPASFNMTQASSTGPTVARTGTQVFTLGGRGATGDGNQINWYPIAGFSGAVAQIFGAADNYGNNSRGRFVVCCNAGSDSTTITEQLRVTGLGSVVLGNQAALATNATDGFTYIPTCAGTPTGTPTAFTGKVAIVFDTTDSQFWVYTGGAWKQPKTPAAAATVTWQ